MILSCSTGKSACLVSLLHLTGVARDAFMRARNHVSLNVENLLGSPLHK